MGSEAPAGSAVLHLRLPLQADIRLLRDGALLHQARSREFDLPIDAAGAYRVEARIDGRLWLLSNAIGLRHKAV